MLLIIVIISLSLVSAGFWGNLFGTGKVVETGEILIEEDIGDLSFTSSDVLERNCELMEFEGVPDTHTCDSYLAKYDILEGGSGGEDVGVMVEVRDEEPTDKEGIMERITTNLIEINEMDLHIEAGVYKLEKDKGEVSDFVFLWISGEKIIYIGVDDWNVDLVDDDLFQNLVDAYLEKYPSDFLEPSACSVYTTMDLCLDNESCAWDQETYSCITYIPGVESCSDPDGGLDYFAQAHTYGYRAIYEDKRDMRIRTGGLDECIPGTNQVTEHFCTDEGNISHVNYNCPKGCVNGACIPENLVVDFGAKKDLVVDYETGFTWQRKGAGMKTFDSARNYCEILNSGGFGDWRLPRDYELELLPIERVERNVNYWTSEENYGEDIIPPRTVRDYTHAVVLKWLDNNTIVEQDLLQTSKANVICIRDKKLVGDELTGTQTCQLCRNFDSTLFFGGFLGFGRLTRPLTTQWDCVGFDDTSLNTDFLMDVYERSSLSLSVSCGDVDVAKDCQICRRYADHNGRDGAEWECKKFEGKGLKTNFVGDVDRNDDFDLMVTCESEEMQNNCQLCKKYADRNGRDKVEWDCEFFNNTPLLTDFVGDVDENDDFDLKVRCEEEIAPEPGKCFDSDGGVAFYIGGVCIDSDGEIHTDIVNASTWMLTEYNCIDNLNCGSTQIYCAEGYERSGEGDYCLPKEEKNDVYFVYSRKGDFDVSLNDILGENHNLADINFKTSRFKIEVDERMLSAITSNSGYTDTMINSDYDSENYASIISIERHNYEDSEVSSSVFEGAIINIDVLKNQSSFNLTEEEDEVYLFRHEELDNYHSPNTPTIDSSRKGYTVEEITIEGTPARLSRLGGGGEYLFIQSAPTFTGGVWQAGEPNHYGNGAYIYVDFFGDLHFRYKTENQNSRAIFSVGILACECSPGEKGCDGKNYLTCDDGCSWTNNGEVVDECGVLPQCEDLDGGLDYYTESKVCLGEEDCMPDVCDGNVLTEYYCSKTGERASLTYECEIGCSNGACIGCVDNDGNDAFIAGAAQGRIFEGGVDFQEDICLGNTLMERVCRNGYLSFETYECPGGCNAGKCNTVECGVNVSGCEDSNYDGLHCGEIHYVPTWDGEAPGGLYPRPYTVCRVTEYLNEPFDSIILPIEEQDLYNLTDATEPVVENVDVLAITQGSAPSDLITIGSKQTSKIVLYSSFGIVNPAENGTIEIYYHDIVGDYSPVGKYRYVSQYDLNEDGLLPEVEIGQINILPNSLSIKIKIEVPEELVITLENDVGKRYITILNLDTMQTREVESIYVDWGMNTGGSTSTVTDCIGPGNIQTCGELGCDPVTGVCAAITCSDNDVGDYENVTSSSANDSLGNVIEDSCDGDTLKEAVCVEGEVDTVDYECEFGCEEGRCLGESSCNDSDGGLNYFKKGYTTSCVGDDCIIGENESCLDNEILWESYCGKNDEIVFQQFMCPEGCVNGACNIPEEKPKATCDPVVIGGPEIKPGIRLLVNGTLSYCDPFTLDYIIVKSADEDCTNDYECESNVCIEGKCSSIREELETQREILEEQTTILQEIRCWLRDFIGVQDYDECLNESLGG